MPLVLGPKNWESLGSAGGGVLSGETVKNVIVTATPLATIFCGNLFRKGEKRDQKVDRNPGPLLEPSSIGTVTEGSENGPIFGPALRCRKTTLEHVLGVAKSGHGSRNTVQCHQFFPRCSWMSEAPSYCLS